MVADMATKSTTQCTMLVINTKLLNASSCRIMDSEKSRNCVYILWSELNVNVVYWGCSHDFIGAFVTNLRELTRGPTDGTAFEV